MTEALANHIETSHINDDDDNNNNNNNNNNNKLRLFVTK